MPVKKLHVLCRRRHAATAVAVPATPAATTAKLRLVSQQPLVVRGEAFRPAERVVVTALTPTGPKRAVVRATAKGRFGATFRLPNQPCGRAFAVRAVGASREPGDLDRSRAALRAPAARLADLGERGRAGYPRPSVLEGARPELLPGGVTWTCMKPPRVALDAHVVPVFGTLTLFHSGLVAGIPRSAPGHRATQ